MLGRVKSSIADPGDGALLPEGASATTGGLAVVGVGLLENITANRAELTIVALLLVAAFVIIRYRNLTRAVGRRLVGRAGACAGHHAQPPHHSQWPARGGHVCRVRSAVDRSLRRGTGAWVRSGGGDHDRRTGRAFFTSALTTLGGFAVLMFSSLPLLADFGMVVTINIAVALLAALVVVPPLIKEADRRGLLAMDERRLVVDPRRRVVSLVGGAALAVVGVLMISNAVRVTTLATAEARTTGSIESPATIPPVTTAAPTTSLAPDSTLPPGPPERPSGLVAGAFYDGLVAVGVDPGAARCAADDLLASTSEADLLTMGIAETPRPAEVDALLDTAATRCGVTRAQLDAAG